MTAAVTSPVALPVRSPARSALHAPVFTQAGQRIALGTLLGRGGEGAVYALAGHLLADQAPRVAKLYHQRPDRTKQDKLRQMVAARDAALLDYCAWPEETLHGRDGAAIGFVMQDIGRRRSIHTVYSPIDRLDSLPHAGFDYLLAVARNVAAAFSTLHAHGHVLGDVNQGNVVVDADARVMLIDCDSFQVQFGDMHGGGTRHLCEVGVGHFTPPELQGLTTFAGCTRSANHDNFGLALLIFHLLMGGRHPYSGVPHAVQPRKVRAVQAEQLIPEHRQAAQLHAALVHAGEALETDIRALRYAYAPDAAHRGLTAPPRTVPIGVLPPALQQMFMRAFTERGVRGPRPTAGDWLRALDALLARLAPCSSQRSHHYPAGLPRCPWCALEAHDVVLFCDPVPLGGLDAQRAGQAAHAAVAAAWQRIEAVAPPAPVRAPPVDPRSLALSTPAPLHRLPGRRRWLLHLLGAALLALGVLLLAPGAPVLAAILGTLAFLLANSFAQAPWRRGLARARARVAAARQVLQRELAALDDCAGPAGFERIKARLQQVRAALERQGRAAGEATMPGRRRRHRRLRAGARRRPLERLLLAGPAALSQYRQQAAARVTAAQPRLQSAARRVAEAEAAVRALEGWRWPA